MSKRPELIANAAGRKVPAEVNGRKQVPFKGVAAHAAEGTKHRPPVRSCRDYPADGDKRVASLEQALENCGLTDGMVISTHHHLRNGDRVALETLRTAAKMGARDLMWFPSASFPCHAPVIDLMEAGSVHHITLAHAMHAL